MLRFPLGSAETRAQKWTALEKKKEGMEETENKTRPVNHTHPFPPHSLTLHQTPICPPFKETWIFLIPSLIKITYIKERVRLHQGFHLLYNEVNAETQWLPQQCKWRPNDNLHYLNKVIAITLRYSNEDGRFELSALNSPAPSPKHMRIDFGIIQCVSSNSTWCKPRAARNAKSLKSGGGGGAGWAGLTRKKMFKVATPSLTLKRPWESLSGSPIHCQCQCFFLAY